MFSRIAIIHSHGCIGTALIKELSKRSLIAAFMLIHEPHHNNRNKSLPEQCKVKNRLWSCGNKVKMAL